ncbi:thyrotropin-releasing hormone receptor-like [Dreissena polymorpha]|uniref:thyrotropin-releasing hormone receptor-like n=1 Tax=Dreissena polymorpha TaxID=45954 RepID=UPI0022651A1F|nr:thyrotropin-releasing hormone receptor-like [Dreissena polymorpha]
MEVSSNYSSISNGTVNNQSSSYNWLPTYQPILYATLLSPIIVFGIVGNVLSILVWNKGKRRMKTTSRYMSALAVADILVLSLAASETWLWNVLEIRLRDYSLALCGALSYCQCVPRVISAWILVVAAVERAMGVLMPHRARLTCRPNIAVIIIGLVCGLLSCAYFPFYIDINIYHYNGTGGTEYTLCRYQHTFSDISIFDLCMFFVGPFSIIIICNVLILINIIKRKQAIKDFGSQTTGNRGNQHMLKTVTLRVIILSLTYCLCIAPGQIYWVVNNTLDSSFSVVLYDVFNILMYLNNGVNFILYCMLGSGFRKDLVEMFKCRRGT